MNIQLRSNWGNAIAITLGRKKMTLTTTMNMNIKDTYQRNELVLGSIEGGGPFHIKSLLIITPYVTKCTGKKINTFPENVLKGLTDQS